MQNKTITVTFNPKRLMRIWSGMVARCHNAKSKYYKNYGARGIKVQKRWRNNFCEFAWWSIHNGYADNLTIDRKNNDAGYTPRNCRWITIQEQQLNKTDSRHITINGVTKICSQWSKEYNIPVETLRNRHIKGYKNERLIAKALSKLGEKNISKENENTKRPYRVRVERNEKKIEIGCFETLEQAIAARDEFLKREQECSKQS